MVNYICKLCNKEFNRKSSYITHIEKKKNPCNQSSDTEIEDPPKIHQNPPKLHQNPPIIHQNSTKKIFKVDKVISNTLYSQKYMCNFCNEPFCRSDVLKKHLDRCKIRKDINKDKEEILQLLIIQAEEFKKQDAKINNLIEENKKINEVNKQLNNLVEELSKTYKKTKLTNYSNINCANANSNNNINSGNIITTNIKIEFGKEDLTSIDNSVFYNAFLKATGAQIPSKLIEGIHFNKKYKEFQNVYISDSARNKALIFKDDKWIITNTEELINNLLDKAINYTDNKKDELDDEIVNNKYKNKIKKGFDIIDLIKGIESHDMDDDGNIIDESGNIIDEKFIKRGERLNEKAKENIKLTLYNNRDLVNK